MELEFVRNDNKLQKDNFNILRRSILKKKYYKNVFIFTD